MSLPTALTPPHVVAFYGVWMLGLAGELIGRRKFGTEPDHPDDRGSYRVLQVAILAGGAVAVGAAFLVDATAIEPAGAAFWAGIVVIAAGLALRNAARWTLADRFSWIVGTQDDHEVVDSGPYRWVRHPAYTGSTLAYVGTGLALANWLAVLAFAAACAAGYAYRIPVEEAVLREELGEAYVRYAERTPYRLVPGVW